MTIFSEISQKSLDIFLWSLPNSSQIVEGGYGLCGMNCFQKDSGMFFDIPSVLYFLYITKGVKYFAFHHPLVPERRGLVWGTEITEWQVISGESGDDDSPEGLTPFGRRLDTWDRGLFVCRYLPTDKKFFSPCPLCLRGECKNSYALLNKSQIQRKEEERRWIGNK